MKMSSTCGKESPHSDRTFMICSSFVAKCGKDNIIVCKYKLFEYDYDETWSDILRDDLMKNVSEVSYVFYLQTQCYLIWSLLR
jgi:hypothetical protein